VYAAGALLAAAAPRLGVLIAVVEPGVGDGPADPPVDILTTMWAMMRFTRSALAGRRRELGSKA
jgi:hypothetical protein